MYICSVFITYLPSMLMIKRRYWLIALLSQLLLLSGCFSAVEDTENELDGGETTSLQVQTRAAVGDVPYPVLILAYDEAGTLSAEQTLKGEADKLKLNLKEGAYHITALSGQEAYGEPSSYGKSSSLLTAPSTGYATTPLMMGGADVLLSGKSAMVNVLMSYRVASIELSLTEVPAEVTVVKVGISQQYGAIDMTGALSKSSTATIDCEKVGSVWQTEKTYVLPGSGNQTTLTLTLISPNGQTSYSYVLSEALQTSVPYVIRGKYVASVAPTITGVITMEGWQDERKIDFDFGSGNSGNVIDVPDIGVSKLPKAGSLWKGHVVALVDNETSNEADLLLLSLEEFTDVYSSLSEGHETQMADQAQSYIEDDLEGWSVPTEAQAKLLRSAYAGNYDDLNVEIERQNGILITVSTAANNARYLCENGTKTFNFATNGSITKAGAKVKYRLRLVKQVHVTVR